MCDELPGISYFACDIADIILVLVIYICHCVFILRHLILKRDGKCQI